MTSGTIRLRNANLDKIVPQLGQITDYECPMKPFLSKSQTFGLGQINFGAFGVFLANLSLVQVFVNQPLFLQKKKPENLGRKELGIRVSIVRGSNQCLEIMTYVTTSFHARYN